MKIPLGTQQIQLRPYILNTFLSKQADTIMDSYIAASLIQHSIFPWSSPAVRVPKKPGGSQVKGSYQKLNRVTEVPEITTLCVNEVLNNLDSVFSVFDVRPLLGVHSVNHPPGYYPPDCFVHPQRTLRMASHSPRRRQRFRLVYTRFIRLFTVALDNIRMHIDDAIGSNESPINHVVTPVTFCARLGLQN